MTADPTGLSQDDLSVQRSPEPNTDPHINPAADRCHDHHDLTALEQRLCAAAHAGDGLVEVDLLDGEAPDREAMQTWRPERSVRATVLRGLLLDASLPIDPRGIRLAGVRIVGELDLTSATIPRPLLLHYGLAHE